MLIFFPTIRAVFYDVHRGALFDAADVMFFRDFFVVRLCVRRKEELFATLFFFFVFFFFCFNHRLEYNHGERKRERERERERVTVITKDAGDLNKKAEGRERERRKVEEEGRGGKK